jgi:hypothetical protein
MTRAVTVENLGAWLLKANGVTSDIAEVAARREPIRRWCVQPGYRTRLMAAGQPVIFWVSGDRRRVSPGIWAVGELSGPPAVADGKLRVPLELRWLDEDQRVHRDSLLADGGLTTLEVLRQPQAGNPSFVTVEQLIALRAYLAG